MVFLTCRNLCKNILWLQWIAAMGAMVTLFTLGLMIGWPSSYLAQLLADDSPIPITLDQAAWVVSLLNLGRLLGAIVGGISVQCFGSKRTLVIIGFPLIISWVFIIVGNSVTWLYAARMLSGLSLGMSYTSLPLYLGEVSSPTIRGSLVSLAISGVRFGTLVGNVMGNFISMTLFSYVSLVPTVAFILLFLWIPQSPYYLVRLGRMEDAEKSIARYNPHVKSKLELESLKDFITSSKTLSFPEQLREFNIPHNRKAVIIMLALFFFMQFSGLNTVIFYLEIILHVSNLTVISPAVAVIIASTVGVIAGWISVFIADKFKRKILMIVSSAGVGVSMVALGAHSALLSSSFDHNALQWLPFISIIVFEIFISYGIVTVPNMILSELFAPNIKNLAACFTSILLVLFSFLSAKSYAPLIDAVGEACAFWIHALLMAMCVIFSAVFLPETRGKSLQEIQAALKRK